MKRIRFIAARVLTLTGALASATVAARAAPAAKVTYQDHVRPILQQHCFACHSQDDRNSDLALDNYDDVIVGGASGEVVAGGDADGSRLWMLVTHQDAPEMPPGGDKLPQDQLDVIKAWIDGGLLKDSGSKPKRRTTAAVGGFVPSADNRPQSEPAMPAAQFREPVVYTPRPGAVDAADVSPWAPVAAVGGLRQVSLYHTETGELLGIIPYPEGMPRSIHFSRDGSLLVVGGGWPAQFGNAALYDVKTGGRITTVGEETDEVLAADLSPDHSLIALGGPKKVVRVYRVADGALAYEIRKHTEWITAIQFSPDGTLLATADRGGGLYLWDGPAGNERAELRGHAEHVTSVSWRTDSKVVASASEDATVRLWQTDGKQIKSWNAHGRGVLDVNFSRDGMITTAGRDRWIKTWTVDGKHTRDIVRLRDVALVSRPTHDSTLVLAADWSGRVQLFEAASGEPQAELPPNPPTLAMRVADAVDQVKRTTKARAEAEQHLAELTAQFAQAEAAVADFQMRRASAEQETNDSNQARVAAAAEVSELTVAWRSAIEGAAESASKLAAKKNELAAAKDRFDELQAEGSFDGGSSGQNEAEQMQQQKRAIEEIAAVVDQLREKVASAERNVVEAKQRTDVAREATDAAAARYVSAERLVAEIDATSDQLPNIASIERDLAVAEAECERAIACHDRSLAVHTAAVDEQHAFEHAIETVAARIQVCQQEVAQSESQLAQLQQHQEKLLAEVGRRKETAEEVSEQIEQLREQLNALRADERQARNAAEQHEQQLEQMRTSVADATHNAALAAAKLEQLRAAQRLRERYSQTALERDERSSQ